MNAQVDNVPAGETSPARANITVNTIPTIAPVGQPANATVCLGTTATFTVNPAGTAPLTYQWYIGTTPLVAGVQGSGSTMPSVTLPTLTINNAQLADAVSNYNVVVSNMCGSVTSNNASLTVNTPPTISCPGNQAANTAPGTCSAVVTYSSSSTGSPAPVITYSFAGVTTGSGAGNGSGSTFNKGTTVVTLTATNICGTVNCSFDVVVTDNINPGITCPANITVNNTANQCGANVSYTATATDNCPGVSVSYSPASGSFFPIGTTTVTATATDAAGRTASCTFTVTVVDAQNPSITCPANITVNNTANQCGANVSYTATATDNCPGVSVGYSPASGSFFSVGTTTVTATATDAVGRTANCTFTVTVVDAQNPSISLSCRYHSH